MHDPTTLAFSIKWPWKGKHDYRHSIIDIWHCDPCKDGTDDSCGWFKRSRHGDKKVLEKIAKRFEEDWDRVYMSETEDEETGKSSIYFCGYFCPNGDPHLSVNAIVNNLIFLAAFEHFKSRDKAIKFCQKHCFEIMLFGENPFDSLHASITRKFYGRKPETAHQRKYRIEELASIIYGWILRADLKWYQHARWHLHHWSIKIVVLQDFVRWLKGPDKSCQQGCTLK